MMKDWITLTAEDGEPLRIRTAAILYYRAENHTIQSGNTRIWLDGNKELAVKEPPSYLDECLSVTGKSSYTLENI